MEKELYCFKNAQHSHYTPGRCTSSMELFSRYLFWNMHLCKRLGTTWLFYSSIFSSASYWFGKRSWSYRLEPTRATNRRTVNCKKIRNRWISSQISVDNSMWTTYVCFSLMQVQLRTPSRNTAYRCIFDLHEVRDTLNPPAGRSYTVCY